MSEVVIYKTKNGRIELDVNLSEETVWLSQKQLADLFDKNTVSRIDDCYGNGRAAVRIVGDCLEWLG